VSDSRVRRGRRGASLTVDLHGLGLAPSMEMTAWALRSPSRELTIITGRGLHSPGGKPVIKPEVERYLSRNGYWWHHQEMDEPGPEPGAPRRVNPGAIVVSRM